MIVNTLLIFSSKIKNTNGRIMDGQLFGIHIGHSSAFLAFFDADKPSNIVFDRIRLFAL